jgi:hypothetical protein
VCWLIRGAFCASLSKGPREIGVPYLPGCIVRWPPAPRLIKPSEQIPRVVIRCSMPPILTNCASSIRTGTVNDWIRSLTAKELEPKTIHNVWKDFRAVVNTQTDG